MLINQYVTADSIIFKHKMHHCIVHSSISIYLQTEYRNMYNHQKMENIKEGAYFDYFKFFSINAAETIRKLQLTIQEELSDDIFFDPNNMFKRIKTLLSSYELLILQINDSCEFVEIPQFGVCILKIFFQLMSIIRFMAKSMILRSAAEKSVQRQKRIDQRHTMLSAPMASLDKKKADYCSPSSIERQNFRIKEMACHIFKDLNKEVVVLEGEQKMMSLENDNTFQKISRGRERLQEIQSSQNEALLSEAVAMLYKKGEYINSFLNQIQSSINIQVKENINAENYSKIKELYDEDAAPRFQAAKNKLTQLFKQYVYAAELRKKQAMVSEQCQVFIEEQDSDQKNKSHSHGKKFLNEQIKKLKNDNRVIEEENITLKALIIEKTQSYEMLIANFHLQKQQLTRKSTYDRENTPNRIKNNYVANGQGRSNKSDEQKENDQCEDGPLAHKKCKEEKASKDNNKSRVVLCQNGRGLYICDRIIHFIANYPSSYVFNRDVFESQTIVYEIQGSKQVQYTNSRNLTPQQSYQQRNDSFGIQQRPKFLKKRYKPRMSCGLFGWEGSLKEDVADISDSPLLRIKDGNDSANRISPTFKEKCQNHAAQQIDEKINQHKATIQLNQQKLQLKDKISTENKAPPPSTRNTLRQPSGFKRQKKQTIRIQALNHATSSVKLPGEKSMNAPIHLAVHTDLKLSSKGVQFQKQDLINLFASEDNARNYELLNLALGAKANHYLTNIGNKNVVIKQSKQASSQLPNRIAPIKNGLSVAKQQQTQNINRCNLLINLIYKALKTLSQIKREPEFAKYHCIKNFLRFPHSSVYRRNENSWKQHEKENNSLQYVQLKKYITRIMKFHSCCNLQQPLNKLNAISNKVVSLNLGNSVQNAVCQHWSSFLRRIGANVANQY